jgi:hypothetical protein
VAVQRAYGARADRLVDALRWDAYPWYALIYLQSWVQQSAAIEGDPDPAIECCRPALDPDPGMVRPRWMPLLAWSLPQWLWPYGPWPCGRGHACQRTLPQEVQAAHLAAALVGDAAPLAAPRALCADLGGVDLRRGLMRLRGGRYRATHPSASEAAACLDLPSLLAVHAATPLLFWGVGNRHPPANERRMQGGYLLVYCPNEPGFRREDARRVNTPSLGGAGS